MMSWIGWAVASLVPALGLLAIIYFTDRRREPPWLLLVVFGLGAAAKVGTWLLEGRAATWTGIDASARSSGGVESMLYLFGFVAPMREASKVAAMWPAFRSKYFDEATDGPLYAASSALSFALVENILLLRDRPFAWIWVVRSLIALPAHVFFACAWGYALGRAKRIKRPGALFPWTWMGATAVHAVYIHLVYGRGPGALVGTLPLLLAMALVTYFVVRDLRGREDVIVAERGSRASVLLERASALYFAPEPPSLDTVREAMRRQGRPITLRWVLFGALVTMGAMTAGLSLAVAFGHWAHVDFSAVDEHDVSTTAPVAILSAGVLLAFPVSGYLVARASSLPSLLEPALAAALAIALTVVLLGLAAPVALVFALAFSPIAWALSCAGAWVGRSGGRGA